MLATREDSDLSARTISWYTISMISRTLRSVVLAVILPGAVFPALAAGPPTPAQEAPADARIREIEAWRTAREGRLRSENGWLTLVGLAWLQPGENPFGSAAKNAVVLPEGSAPAVAGSFVLDGGKVRLVAAAEAGVTVGGQPASNQVVRSDADGEPDDIRVGRLRLTLIRRGDRLGIRVKDPESPVRTGFRGIESFPTNLAWRIEGTFVPYDPPHELEIPTVLGTVEKMQAPGLVRFASAGREFTLEPVLENPGDQQLFFIFRDATSGKETYEAGRFLYTDLPKDGRVTVDFNQAYNPPCAFTHFATCPLPPKKNWLPIRVEAGEKKYGAHP